MLGPEQWTEKYLMIPFKTLGFDKKGCHCWGLVHFVYKRELKVELPKYDTITSTQVREMLKAKDSEIARGPWKDVHPSELKSFDVLVMSATGEDGRSAERHIGIYAGNGFILHIEEGVDSRCERLHGLTCKHRVAKAFRYEQNATA